MGMPPLINKVPERRENLAKICSTVAEQSHQKKKNKNNKKNRMHTKT